MANGQHVRLAPLFADRAFKGLAYGGFALRTREFVDLAALRRSLMKKVAIFTSRMILLGRPYTQPEALS
jgi:hypothetical protein